MSRPLSRLSPQQAGALLAALFPPGRLMRYMIGSNAEVVAMILNNSFATARTALDLTPGRGCFWSKKYPVNVDVTFSDYDFRDLPYADASVDVVLIDPPYRENDGVNSIMIARYGSYATGESQPAIRAGVGEAWRVARLGVIVKVANHIHNQRFTDMTGWVRDELGTPF